MRCGWYFYYCFPINPNNINIPNILQKDKLIEGQLLLFDKPYRWSSFKLVNDVRYKLCKKNGIKKLKVGHAGTLDPLATGLMIIGTGRATKQLGNLTDTDKEYIAELKLGETTPSFDNETKVNAKFETNHITIELIEQTLIKFIGNVEQIPPLFSAKKVDGIRAYELARNGEKHELKPVIVKISNIEILDFSMPYLVIKVNCSKGTYIRSLVHDIGVSLGSGAFLNNLKRTAIGDFSLANAWSVEKFYKIINWV